jgi:hypothetical protein
MADKLESYLKKKLSEEAPAEDGWNVPSDSVWENVLPEIQKEKGVFIPWKYIYILAFLLLAILALIWWFRAKDDRADSGMIQEEIPMVIESSPTEEKDNIAAGNDDPGIGSDGESLNEETAESERGVFAENEITENTENENLPPENIKADHNPSGQPMIKEADKTISADSEMLPSPAFSITVINFMDKLSVNKLALTNDSAVILNKSRDIPVGGDESHRTDEPFDNKGKWAAGVYFIPTFNNTTVLGDPSQGDILETSKMLMYSSNWGFELKYFISNRFTLITGIGKSEIRSWSRSTVDFGYDSSTEQTMPGGEKENTSPVPMHTPFGMIDTQITYTFSGDDDIPDGDPMNSVLETHMDVRYLSIPLGVELNIIRFQRFSWFAEVGIRYNRALLDATDFTSRVLHNGQDMEIVNEIMTSDPEYTRQYLGFFTGTGLNYQFSKSFQAGFSARYFGNLTPVNYMDDMSTYMQGFDFKIGLIYLF